MLECIRRFEPAVYDGLQTIAGDWDTPGRAATLAAVFPTLKKISIDFAVMEPASRDARFRVAAVPMPLRWLDVGSWPAYADTCPRDDRGNAAAGQNLLLESAGCLVVSADPKHLVAAIGCDDLIVVHTPDATLVCRKDRAEQIKELYKQLPPQLQ
jgi:mannose-1-phosphate guanylyltransferase